ncbi:hypothetical protein Q8309_001385 [Salmonella enterica]|nr:hypothetical protein [Salmonella enterica]
MTNTPDAELRNAARQDELLTARLALAVHEYDESKVPVKHLQVINRTRILRSALNRFRSMR